LAIFSTNFVFSEEETEFEIITYDQKRWEFSAASVEERDEWVALIEEQIEKSLQSQLSQKQQQSNRAHGDKAEVLAKKLDKFHSIYFRSKPYVIYQEMTAVLIATPYAQIGPR
jgi:hypothetical protein